MNYPTERDRESPEDADWSTVETYVKGTIAVEVRRKDNYVSGHPPLYSLRVGRARIAQDSSVWISPHMSIYDLHTARELIEELGEKYRILRTQQSGRRVVEQKRSTRMGMSRDGVLETLPATPARSSSTRYYDSAPHDTRDAGQDED